MSTATGLRRHAPWLLPAACVLVVLAGKVVTARSLRAARQDAVRLALLEMRLDLVERVRALEASLRTSRAELEFLAGSPPAASLPATLRTAPPGTERFRLLEAQATLLRSLGAHAEIERLVIEDEAGLPLVAAGRRASAAVPIPLEAAARDAPPGRLRLTRELGGGEGRLVADVNPASLLASQAMGMGRAVLLDETGAPLAGTPDADKRLREAGPPPRPGDDPRIAGGWVAASAALDVGGFDRPVRWVLARAERESEMLAGLGPVAERWRAMLALDALGIIAVVALGALSVRLVQRRARLEEQAAHEERLREMEARLHEADRLASVGRLAATLAHEIRNPLEGMRNWLVLAEDEARAAGAEKALAHARRVGEGIDHLAEVVRRVLAMAKPSTGTIEPLDLGAIAERTLRSVEGTRAFRGIELERDVVPDLPRVRGDAVLIQQVLLNLLLNARDALPEGGRIRVSARADGRDVRIAVSDTGRGIAPDVLPHLFEPFRSGKGSSGLGLALCDRVARVHGGRMEARNDAHGATVALVLPAEGAETPPVTEITA